MTTEEIVKGPLMVTTSSVAATPLWEDVTLSSQAYSSCGHRELIVLVHESRVCKTWAIWRLDAIAGCSSKKKLNCLQVSEILFLRSAQNQRLTRVPHQGAYQLCGTTMRKCVHSGFV